MPQRSIRKTKSSSRRRQIMEAALGCFTELGFSETTMEAIRLRSKASMGSIYHHFKSKEELAAVVYLEGLQNYQSGFIEGLTRCEKAREGVKAMVRYHLGWVEAHRDWARYLFNMRRADFMKVCEQDIKVLNSNFVKEVSNWMSPFIRQGDIRKMPPELYPSVLLGPCQEFAREWLSGALSTPIDSAKFQIAEAVWRSVKGK